MSDSLDPDGQNRYPTPTGQLCARIHGAGAIMRKRAESARKAAREADADGVEPRLGAALRGKAKGFDESANLLEALEQGRALPPKRRNA